MKGANLMGSHNKITWDVIFKDYKDRHPRMKEKVLDFIPYSYATILLIFPDRVRMTYNYDTKKVTKLALEEIEEFDKRGRNK